MTKTQGTKPRRIKKVGLFGGTYYVHEHKCLHCGSKCECHVKDCKDPYLSDCDIWWPTLKCKDRLSKGKR